jgi:uncharacterized protein (TIGR03437 family)
LTINGSGFDSTTVDQIIFPSGYIGSGSRISYSATQVVFSESMAGAAPGSYTVKVKNGASGTPSNGKTLTLIAQVSVSPGSGTAGTAFSYQGSGFTGSFEVTSHLRKPDGSEFATKQIATNSSGQFSDTISSGGFAAGTYQAWAVDNNTGISSSTVSFSVTAAPDSYSIAGRVTDSSNNALSGVTIALAGLANQSTITAEGGSYSFSALPPGDYTLTPSKSGYALTPFKWQFTSLRSNKSNVDFMGCPISGGISFDSITQSLSLIAGGSAESLIVRLRRVNYAGRLTLTVGALPTGVKATSISQPDAGDDGTISVLAYSDAPPIAGQVITITARGLEVASATATFTLNVTPGCQRPQISTSPQSQAVARGETVVLRVAGSGPGTLTYSWYQGPSGDTSHLLTLGTDNYTTPPVSTDSQYWARVANACGSADSGTALIKVKQTSEVSLVGFEVTQGTQDLGNNAILIEGKPTIVRTYVVSDTPLLTRLWDQFFGQPLAVRLDATRISGTQSTYLGSLQPENPNITIPGSMNRTDINSGFYFRLPPDWASGTLQMRLSAPGIICKEDGDAGGDCAVNVAFRESRGISFRIFRFTWTEGDTAHRPSDEEVAAVIDNIKKVFPLSKVRVTGLFEDRRSRPDTEDDFNTLLRDMLSRRDIDCLAGCSQCCTDYYLGLFKDYSLSKTKLCGMAPSIPSFVAAAYVSGFWGCKNGGVVAASHEVGHMLGRCHVRDDNRQDIKSVDDLYPYSEGIIGDPSHDFLGTDITPTTLTFFPRSRPTYDIMSYGKTAWPSDYFLKWVWEYLNTGKGGSEIIWDGSRSWCVPNSGSTSSALFAPLSPPANRVSLTGQEALTVSGELLLPEQAGTLESIYTIAGPGTVPTAKSGAFSIRFEDSGGRELGVYPFDAMISPEDPSRGSFVLTLPRPDGLFRVLLMRGSQVLASRCAFGGSPTVQMVYPNGGEVLTGDTAVVRWTASHPDGVTLTYALRYSADGGVTWRTLVSDVKSTEYEVDLTSLAGSQSALIRVLATDGFTTAQAQSATVFTVSERPPRVVVRSPVDSGLYVGQETIILEALVSDTIDADIPETNIAWSSDRSGILGTGRVVFIRASALPEGPHKVTVSARASRGTVGTSTVAIQVQRGADFTAASITSAASFISGATAGSIVTVFGSGLTSGVNGIVKAEKLPLPTQLAGTSVFVNGIPAPIFAVANIDGKEQINFQMPYEVAGYESVEVVVSTYNGNSAAIPVRLLPAQPGIFTMDGTTAAVLHAADYTLVTMGNPANRGEIVAVYATGLGPVTLSPSTGVAASSEQLSRTVDAVQVTIGGNPAEVLYSGLAPGLVGVYQVNVRIPWDAPAGEAALVISSGGATSKTASVAISAQ